MASAALGRRKTAAKPGRAGRRVLVTGAAGQLGSALAAALREALGPARVVASDVRVPAGAGPAFLKLDVTDGAAVRRAVEGLDVGTVYHLAAVKSAEAERAPAAAWRTNVDGLANSLEALRPIRGTLFFSSSLAAAGVRTLYGVSKRAGELLCGHYRSAHGLDARALRLPVLLHPDMEPGGGGTGDFAVEMLREARGGRPYRCYLSPRTSLPFMHLSDAVRAALSFAAAAGARPLFGASVPGFSLTPERLAVEARRHRPGFRVRYDADPVRQAVADSWPKRLGRAEAPKGWSFEARYGLRETVAEMLSV